MLRNIQVALSSSLRQTSTLGLVSAFKSELRSALFSSSAREASDKDSPKRLQVCVVGSGPSGFYTVSQVILEGLFILISREGNNPKQKSKA